MYQKEKKKKKRRRRRRREYCHTKLDNLDFSKKRKKKDNLDYNFPSEN